MLDPKLCKLFTTCLITKQIPPSWSSARILVMPKKDRDPTLPQSYHFVALLNVDYKIPTFIWAAQINSVVVNYIHLEHSGFIKTRFLKDKPRKICNIGIWGGGDTGASFILLCGWCKRFRLAGVGVYGGTTSEDGLGQSGHVLGEIDIVGAASSYFHPKMHIENDKPDYRGLTAVSSAPATLQLVIETLATVIWTSCNVKGMKILSTEHKLALYTQCRFILVIYWSPWMNCIIGLTDFLSFLIIKLMTSNLTFWGFGFLTN